MPNIKSQKKRMELNREWGKRNRSTRNRVRTAMKRVRKSEDPEEATTRLREAHTLLDRAARRRIFHPNKVARYKSQLQKHVNELAGKG